MIITILILTIFNTLCLLMILLFKMRERLNEMQLDSVIRNRPLPEEEKIDFPPPPPLDETEVIPGSQQEAALAESPSEETSDEREYLQEQKRDAQRGQV